MFFFFFFKQKTAYEMRISDWSSDVCSSDLSDEFPGYGHLFAASNVDYKDLATTRAAIFGIAKELRDQPVDADLLGRARRPLAEAMVKARRENSHWRNYVAEATTPAARPRRTPHATDEAAPSTAESGEGKRSAET